MKETQSQLFTFVSKLDKYEETGQAIKFLDY
jgi:hypothetical protein